MNRLLLVALSALVLQAQDGRDIMLESQKRTSSRSHKYEGTLTVTDSKGKRSVKRWTYDRFGSHGESKAVLRFVEPAEVRGVALLIVNHKDRASDQWMWIPDLGRERRVAMQDRSTRFFGTDFTFEDLEERDVDQYTYRVLGEENINGAPAWKLEAKPKKSSQYTHSYVWVRKPDYVIARIENYKGAQLVRHVSYTQIRVVDGVPAAHTITMQDLGRKSETEIVSDKLRFNVPMTEDQFTLQALRRGS